MDKKNIRKEVIKLRNNINNNDRDDWNKRIFDLLISSDIYKKAKRIFIYVNFRDEVDTKEIIKYSLDNNKEIYIPKTYVKEKTMKAIKINSLDELSVDNYGILEPKVVDKNNIGINFDLIIMPGIAFDMNGNRVGYGAGYYDKFISKLNYSVLKVALSYKLQLVKEIKREEHDINMDYIFTENGLIKI